MRACLLPQGSDLGADNEATSFAHGQMYKRFVFLMIASETYGRAVGEPHGRRDVRRKIKEAILT